jgi:hypothetical protein
LQHALPEAGEGRGRVFRSRALVPAVYTRQPTSRNARMI